MQTTEKQAIKKQLNALGVLYADAAHSKKYAFKEALSAFSERDGMDYWRSFRDVWQYSETIGKAPFAIVATAHNVLGFNPYNEPKK